MMEVIQMYMKHKGKDDVGKPINLSFKQQVRTSNLIIASLSDLIFEHACNI